MYIALPLHVLFAVIWIGGMFFAYQCLRPVAAALLEPAQRLPLWDRTLKKFFIWVWHAVVIIPISGYWMVFVSFGGMSKVGVHVHIMQGLGWVMVAIFLYVFFGPYAKLKQAVATKDWQTGALHLALIRRSVGINLLIGLGLIVVATTGQFL